MFAKLRGTQYSLFFIVAQRPFFPQSDENVENFGKFSFIHLNKVWLLTAPICTKPTTHHRNLVQIHRTEFHTNQTKMWEVDLRIDSH